MKLRRVIEASLLLAGGFVLHQIMPPLIAGMKPDMSLLMLFVVVLLYPEKKLTLLSGLVTGVISALTTTFPGGQVANMIDKPITSFSVLFMILLADHLKLPMKFKLGVIGVLGTIISGSIFLGAASMMVSLPQSFVVLFMSVVLPAALLNTGFLYAIYPIVIQIKKLLPEYDMGSEKEAA
ncbi:tryptophan transporter [Orenia marismortui]|uniref:Tryptophan transporter TrpP n=1 Tax=Orenia marismortui TaxID=46469 RepID=A0A4R8H1V7_9FIRM|nr:tryptophan transporter [Orenia marismortui]TDX52199.1 tryptophan transporter TrpP [Orenia marismortui]